MKLYIRTLAKQQFALQLQLIMKTTEQCKKNIQELTINEPKQHHTPLRCHSGVFDVTFEQISHIVTILTCLVLIIEITNWYS